MKPGESVPDQHPRGRSRSARDVGFLSLAHVVFLTVAVAIQSTPAVAREPRDEPVQADSLLRLDDRDIPADRTWVQALSQMLARREKALMRLLNERENAAWEQVKTRADWENYRDLRLQKLRESLGRFPTASGPPRSLVTRQLEGDGYRIENLVFESRPGLVVTANLYGPSRPSRAMPGILIAHSHHNPKTQGELQDMGMTWARQGCVVLIPDHLGHGERRQHPFRTESDYARPFRVGRQDYYFRYHTGLQLQLVGESLMGWMVWDLMRGIDLLLARPGIDKDRIILLGAVAGGGDPAAVTAVLDPRVKAVVPFNFGGTQPDYAIPADAQRDFYWFGVPDWESTRSLRRGARDGFAQWLIVASVAPRRLIYAHEFAWGQGRDPVWPRLRKVFNEYAPDHLAIANGRGNLRGTPPESSHCNNIGPLHRSQIYPNLLRWFDMPIPEEYSRRRAPEELTCLTEEAVRKFRPKPLHGLLDEVSASETTAARRHLASFDTASRRKWLRQGWERLLGDVASTSPRLVERQQQSIERTIVERIALEPEPGIVVPLLLSIPTPAPNGRIPIVVGLTHRGRKGFLEHRSEALVDLLNGGAAVCLVDVRGTGESAPRNDSPRHNGTRTELSASAWLRGETLVGAQLRDVRAALAYLRGRPDLDAHRIVLWGESFAAPNPPERNLAVPLDADPYPNLSEPLGGLLALFGALFEDDVRAVVVRGGLIGYESLLQSPFFYLPHDALIPGALSMGDLVDVAAALAPRALRMEGLVDGLNRELTLDVMTRALEPVRTSYRASNAEPRLQLGTGADPGRQAARWLLQELRAD